MQSPRRRAQDHSPHIPFLASRALRTLTYLILFVHSLTCALWTLSRRADAISPASSSCINARCGCARRAAFLPPVRAASRSYPLASAEK